MKYKYWLANVPHLSHMRKKMLTGCFGGARAIFEASEKELAACGLLQESQIRALLEKTGRHGLEKKCEDLKRKDICLYTIEDEEYPQRLKDIYDAPYALYVRGTLPSKEEHIVAMVGARRASAYGLTMAREIASALGRADVSIVSGMALGIDGASHEGALAASARTYAVLGCGVDILYPRKNRRLYEQIPGHGALISEFPPETQPLPTQFPVRNRIISGMAEKVLVIEARERSGSLITADLALEQGRDVYALPGRVTDPMSSGTNRLIAQGAGIITSSERITADLFELPDLGTAQGGRRTVPKINLEKEDLLVYSCFDFYAKGIDEVQAECHLDLMPLLSSIVRLTEQGLIKECFKNEYIRLE